MSQRLHWVVLWLAMGACSELPSTPPDPSERVVGGVSSLVTREGLAYLTARLVAEEEALGAVSFNVPLGHVDLATGASLVFGPSEALLALFDARIEPGANSSAGGLSLSYGLRGVDQRIVVLHRPQLGGPERCFLRLELGETRAEGVLYPSGLAESAGAFVLQRVVWRSEDELRITPEEECDHAADEALEAVRAASLDSLQAAIQQHMEAMGQAISAATGLGVSLGGSAPVGASDNVLRFALVPSERSEPGAGLSVQEAGLLARFDVSLDAASSSTGCAPPLSADSLQPSSLPRIPTLAPAGEAYRLAMAFDRVWLQRALGWLGASGRLCRDLAGRSAPSLAELPEVPGIADLINTSQPARLRFRPTDGVTIELHDQGAFPLLVELPSFSLDLYAQVEGAPMAMLRVTGDVVAPLRPVLAEDQLGVELGEVVLDNLQVDAPLSNLSEEAANELGAAMLQAGLELMARSLVVPAPQLPGRALVWVGTEATATHLLLYLDLR